MAAAFPEQLDGSKKRKLLPCMPYVVINEPLSRTTDVELRW